MLCNFDVSPLCVLDYDLSFECHDATGFMYLNAMRDYAARMNCLHSEDGDSRMTLNTPGTVGASLKAAVASPHRRAKVRCILRLGWQRSTAPTIGFRDARCSSCCRTCSRTSVWTAGVDTSFRQNSHNHIRTAVPVSLTSLFSKHSSMADILVLGATGQRMD